MSKAVSQMKGLRLRLSFLLFSFFLLHQLHSQRVQVRVISEISGSSLFDVEVFNENFSSSVFTDIKGEVLLDTLDSKIFHFSKNDFNLLTIDIDKLRSLKWKVEMSSLSEQIDEIVLIGQHSFKESDKFRLSETITKKEIQSISPQTSADVLSQNGNVYVQKSQMGGGSPIIRGFEANRVLLVVDGVRMNNAIYRNGHLQNAITVDATALQSVKVLFGPNSLAYGSDAIGGVVAYSTKVPLFATDNVPKIESNILGRISSANEERTIHGDISVGLKKWAFLTSLSATDFNDLRTGRNRDERFPNFGLRATYAERIDGKDVEVFNPDPNVQIGTAYHQHDFLQKIVYKPNDKFFISGNFQYSNTGNIPRYDNLQEEREGMLRYAEWDYGPQKRLLTSLQIKNYKSISWYDKFIFTGAYQKIREERIVRNFQNENRHTQIEDVNVYSFTGEFSKKINAQFNLFYGFDSQFNQISSTAFTENITTGEISRNVLTRYASDGNVYNTYGIYSELDWNKKNSPFSAKMGIRYSANSWNIAYARNDIVEWPVDFINGINNENSAINWSVSALYQVPKGFFTRALISTAFRAPNIDDLSKIRVNAMEITFPNVNLSPENSISSEVSFGIKNEKINISSTAFFTSLKDAIIRRPFMTPDGSGTYENFGEILDVVANQNVQNAHIFGISLSGQWNILDELLFSCSWNYTKGREKVENQSDLPFAHIPPIYGRIGLKYSVEKFITQLVVNFHGKKDIDDFGGTVDNPDLATPIGSLEWTTYNLYTDYNLTDQFVLNLGIENIFDIHYRPFGSGVSAPGRNIIFSLRYSI